MGEKKEDKDKIVGYVPWKASDQARPMREACKEAKICPPIAFHGLRHSYASLLVKKAVPLQVVAKLIGDKDVRTVEKHYAHLQPSFVADQLKAHLPKFGLDDPKVIAIESGRKGAAAR